MRAWAMLLLGVLLVPWLMVRTASSQGGGAVVIMNPPAHPANVQLRDASGVAVSVGGGTQYAQGAASGSTDTVTMAGVMRQDTPSIISGVADGDVAILKTDALGNLRVHTGTITVGNLAASAANVILRDTTGAYVSPGAGVQYAQGVAAGTTDSVTMSGVMRQDTPAVISGVADGDVTVLKTDALGNLRVHTGTITVGNLAAAAVNVILRDTTGAYVSSSGGTQYNQGVASGAADTMTMAGAIRRDTASVDAGVANGDVVGVSTDASGNLRVHLDYTMARQAGPWTVAATQSGTWTVQPGNTANTTAWKVDGSAVTQPVSGTVTADAGTNLNTSALALETGGNLAAAATSLATLDNIVSGTGVNVSQHAGVAAVTGSGTATGALRVELPTNGTGVVGLNTGTNSVGTVQPGNTQNTTPWLVRESDGTLKSALAAPSIHAATTQTAIVVQERPMPAPVCTSYRGFSHTADTLLVSGVAGQHIYLCSFVVVAGAAEVVSLVEGTGALCATNPTALLGSTTDANGMSFAANGGVAMVARAPFIKTAVHAFNLCLRQSTSSSVSGGISYTVK